MTAANAGPVKVLCPLGCGIEIPVPVRLTTENGSAPVVTVKIEVPPVFTEQMEWHMRRFHGGKDDQPIEVAA